MAQRLRVLLLIPHLGGGGAEQVTALLARGLSRDKYEVHLGLGTRSNAASPPSAALGHGSQFERFKGTFGSFSFAPPGAVAQTRRDPVRDGASQFSCPDAAAILPEVDAGAGAAKRNCLFRVGRWTSARLYTAALPAALPPCGSGDLPVARHGGGYGRRA